MAGFGWMVVSGLNFVAVVIAVKYLGNDVPPILAAFLRYLLGLVFLVPMLRPLLRSGLSRKNHAHYWLRGLVHSLGVYCWFFAMTRITIAEVTSLNYLAPVFVTIGAAIFLGEQLAIRRILAVCAALVGSLIILRPGFREISPGHIAMLGTSLSFGVSYLMAKRMSDTMSPTTIVGMLSITVTVVLAPFAAAVWVPPTAWQLFLLFLVAAFATAGHFTMTMAFRMAPVSAVQPATFLQLVWASAVGVLLFGEALDAWVLAGGAIIIGSASFIAWREAVIASRGR